MCRKTIDLGRGMLLALGLLAGSAVAQDVQIMDGVTPHPDDASMTEVDAFKKDAPWTIGMSHFGVNANTWTVQVSHEAEGAAAGDDRISKLIMLDAGFDQAKQVSDIEDLIAQKVDVLIVMPVTETSADAGIEKAVNAGIPVVLHTGRTGTDKYTTEIQGGAEHFGKVMGDFLVDQLGGKGDIWVLRGLAGHPEDTNRYAGLMQSLEGTDIKIVQEDAGSWQYDNGKKSLRDVFSKQSKG